MAITTHIEENAPSPVALSKHICPLCSYEWWEMTDAGDYPYYCPGCGKPYSPRESEVYVKVEENMLEEYRDYFNTPSEADMVIAEAQEKLRNLFNDVTKATCERARNAELELSRLQGEITAAQYKLEAVKRQEQGIRQNMERYKHHDFPLEVVQDIMRELTLDFCPGDKAYIVSLTKAENPCDYCGGEGQFEATASGVSPKLIKCPKCEGRKKLAYAVNKPVEITVASVRPSLMFDKKGIRTWKDECIIGDDNGYYSANDTVFKTLEEAQAKADKLNGNRKQEAGA